MFNEYFIDLNFDLYIMEFGVVLEILKLLYMISDMIRGESVFSIGEEIGDEIGYFFLEFGKISIFLNIFNYYIFDIVLLINNIVNFY